MSLIWMILALPSLLEAARLIGIGSPSRVVTLHDGQQMPLVAFGTAATSLSALGSAILTGGVRHIDSAIHYGEQRLGLALAEFLRNNFHNIRREDLFLTSKVEPSNARIRTVLEKFSQKRARQADVNNVVVSMVEQSIRDLKVEKLNLLLAHSAPLKREHLLPFWRAIEHVRDVKKLTTSIGASNFAVLDLQDLKSNSCSMPVVNQFQFHPFFQGMMGDRMLGENIVSYCTQHNVVIMAYSPLQPLQIVDQKRFPSSWLSQTYLESQLAQVEGTSSDDQEVWLPENADVGMVEEIRNEYSRTIETMAGVDAHALYLWHLGADAPRGIVTATSNPARASALASIAKPNLTTARQLSRSLRRKLDAAVQWSEGFLRYCGLRTVFDDQGRQIN